VVRAGAAEPVRFVSVLVSTRAGGGFGRSASRSGLASRGGKAVSRSPPPARRSEKLWPMPGSRVSAAWEAPASEASGRATAVGTEVGRFSVLGRSLHLAVTTAAVASRPPAFGPQGAR
jgi:hypothetical protein